jgi:alkylation response protein AidB-like acyl-CoA dehydrogenase
MLYDLTEEQEMIRQTVRKLAVDRVAPRAAEIDETAEYPWDILDILKENALMGADVPEEYGGTGSGALALCIIIEELSKACATTGLMPAVQELGLLPILLGGSEEQKKNFLPKIASGEHISACAITESSAGSDVGGIQTRAVKEGDEYVLNGSKIFITNGGIADIYSLFAKTDPDASKPSKALSVFIVEKDAPGFTIGKYEDKLGIRGSKTSELIFEDCRIPAANLISKEGMGFAICMKTLDFSRPGIAAQALGIAQGALDYAIGYAKERKQFGKPITAFQGIQFMLADMTTQVEAARQLLYKTASLLEEQTKDMSRLPAEVVRFSSMSKNFASDTAMKVTVDAIQVLGGYGYIKEYPVERMMRDAKITQLYEGTNQVQRIVIANTLLG